jgi:hypothetical protein
MYKEVTELEGDGFMVKDIKGRRIVLDSAGRPK